MKKTSRVLYILVSVLLIPFVAYAQENGDQKHAEYKFTTKGLVRNVYENDSLVKSINVLKPILIFKSKYEVDTENGDSRFAIRNARVGIQGNLSRIFSYKFMVDLSADGKFQVLDLYAGIKVSNRVEFKVGQGGIPLFNSYTISPNSIDYVNRPFVGKYFNSSRDIGVTASFKLKKNGFPIALDAGIYNGDGINNPKWTTSFAYGGRILFGGMKGWRTTAKFYRTKNDDLNNYFIWGADLRYEADSYKIEAEYMNKYNNSHDSSVEPYKSLSAMYIQGLYKIALNSVAVKRLEPCLRWDGMGYDIFNKGLGCNRATAGLNLVFNTNAFLTLVRLNYEHYFNNSKDMSKVFTTDYHNDSKLSLEVLLVF